MSEADREQQLLEAAEEGQADRVRELLSTGVAADASDAKNRTALVYAASGGDAAVVQTLIDAGADVNVASTTGKTALMYAADAYNIDAARCLVDRGAGVNAASAKGKTALMLAASGRDAELARYLVDHGADVHAADREGSTALMRAVWGRNIEAIRFLANQGADASAVDKDGESALIRASASCTIDLKLDIVRCLVDIGAPLNAVDRDGRSALVCASERGELDVVQCLVEGGASIDGVIEGVKRALVSASKAGKLDVVRYLVDQGADLNGVDEDGKTALMRATERDYMEVVRYLVDQGADVNAVDSNRKSALIAACERGDTDAVEYLVERGAEVNAADNAGKTALMLVLGGEDIDLAQFLIDHGADVNAVSASGKTALMRASKSGNMDTVRLLVDSGADINAVKTDGNTALLYASKKPQTDVVLYLVGRGADVDAAQKNGMTALMWASWHKDGMDIMQCLVAGGTDMNAADEDGKTALMYAVEDINSDTVQYLVENGANTSAAQKDGTTVLMIALMGEDAEMVEYLIDGDANVNAANKHGKTVLMYASEYSDVDIMQRLVEGGADVNEASKDGKTALMRAADREDLEIVEWLVENGANVNAVDEDGETALIYAADSGELDLVRHLVASNANANAVTKKGKTALMFAAKSGDMDIVEYLVESGAHVNETSVGVKQALIYAAAEDNLDVVEFLVEHGADVDARDKNGKSALMHASHLDNMDVVRYLIDQGADVNAVSKDGKTVLMWAYRGNVNLVRYLVKHGADMHAIDNKGNTAVMHAVGDLTLVDVLDTLHYLMDGGIDVNAAAKNGVTPLMRASYNDRKIDIVARLIEGGADVNAVDETGKTALMCASELDNPDIVQYLVSHGADVNHKDHDGRTAMFFASSNGHVEVQRLLTPLLQGFQNDASSSHEMRLDPDTRLSRSWFISPFEIELLDIIDREDLDVQFRAKWLDAHVVVKLFVPGASMASFVDEVSVWRRLRHPNVTKLYGACDVGHYFFVSEFARNGSVVEHLAAYRRAGVRGTPWKFLHEAALGLAFLHEREIVHGNLRASNILIGDDGLTKLAEFSLSGSESRSFSGTAYSAFGERRWLPWECITGGGRTFASDVYSLGLCVIEALNGRIPWEDQTDDNVSSEKKDWDPATDVELSAPGRIKGDARVLVAKMCALDPTKRISAAEAAQILERLAANERDDSTPRQPEPEMVASIDEFDHGELKRKPRLEEQRLQQREAFVTEVSETLLHLDEIDEEDLVILFEILKAEIDTHKADFSQDQLKAIESARDTVAQRTSAGDLVTIPEWFLPWYELVIDNKNCVGTGGFGGVYRAKWLDSEVVVKLLDQIGAASSTEFSMMSTMSSYMSSSVMSRVTTTADNREEQKKMREMFAREVSVWFGLSHPHVVRLFGACHIGTQFFACEFAGNGSLDKYLRKHSDELWQKLYEAALGVQYLHSRGIVHGDLKCNNVLIGGDGKAKVTDFGLSYDSALLDKGETQVSGAWHWVAPECLKHGASQLSAASDVYSLGMCIVEALRIVEMTRLELDASTYSPLPWGNLDNVAVKYHVVQKGVLPLRPQLATDDEWALVTRMCAYDQTHRLKISTVVDEFGRFMGEGKGTKWKARPGGDIRTSTPVSDIIAGLKICDDAARSSSSAGQETHNMIFSLLWHRLEHLSTAIANDDGDVESLRELVEMARVETLVLADSPDTLIQLIQAAMRGYTLHRKLDKLMEANSWRTDDDGVHEWKSRCGELLHPVCRGRDTSTFELDGAVHSQM